MKKENLFANRVWNLAQQGKKPKDILQTILNENLKTSIGTTPNYNTIQNVLFSRRRALEGKKTKRLKSKIFDDKEETKLVTPPLEIKYTPIIDKVAIVFTTRSNIAEVIKSYMENE